MAAMTVASAAYADDFVPGSTKCFKPGYSLELVWGQAVPVGNGVARTGIGVNNKFYAPDYANGIVKVFSSDGSSKDIKMSGKLWVSCTVDQAGHVIVRDDNPGWPGAGTAGNYVPDNGSIAIIDSKNDAIIKEKLPMTGAIVSRFDALGPVHGDILNDEFTAIYAPVAFTSRSLIEFSYTQGEYNQATESRYKIHEAFTGEAKAPQTLAMAQALDMDNLAVYPNPRIDETGSAHGLGNGIMHFEYVVTDETEGWEANGKFYVTPDHAAIGGFYIFELNGKQFIVYPSAGVEVAADAFAVTEVTFADSPISDPEEDKDHLIARKFAATNEAGAILYSPAAYFMGINVEPVADDPNSVLIYTYVAGKNESPAMVHKFTYDPNVDPGAVEEIEVADPNAPVEYFNLQGIRVANPENGLFIRRQGAKVSKVAL